MTTPHRWTFYRIGGLDQVALETGDDLANLAQLDQKLWVALSCPTKGLELDARTLELLDLDKDGRVRASELLAAIEWSKARLRSLGELIPGRDGLQLASIDEGTAEGKALLGAARRILAHRGQPDAKELKAADVADTKDVFAGTKLNGDGVVTPDSADDAATRQAIADAVACTGGVADRSGPPGVDKARLDAFFADLAAFAEWAGKGSDAAIQTLADATPAAHAALAAIEAKVSDYFSRCKLAAFDPRAGALLNRAEAELSALAAKDLATPGPEVAALPLAHVEAGRALPLTDGGNPAWAAQLAAFKRDAVAKVFGESKSSLTEAEFDDLRGKLAPYAAHLAGKKGASVEKLGLARARELLASSAKASIEALIEQDLALSAEGNAIADAVRMVHYRRDLHTLLRNFVNFADFYDPTLNAVFQSGTLYLDSRSCDLCIRVDDPGAHSVLGSLGRFYIAYCDCRRPGESMKIAACFSQGDSDYLMVGRNGVFYDRKGRDWDATITKVIDNPISIRQAFWAPYKKFVRLVEEQAMKFAASKEKESDARVAGAAAAVGDSATGKPPAPPSPVDVGKMVGIIAALGVGVGAIGTLFGGLVSGFLNLQPWWAKLLAGVGVVLVISGPSVLLAWLKLRQRTLGPVLDANGWAVNGRVKVNIPLGTALTSIKELPTNAKRSLDDPFEDKVARRRRRLVWAAAIVALIGALLFRYREAWWHYVQR